MSYYGTLYEADDYFLTKRLDPQQLWALSPNTLKEAALSEATRRMDMLNFTGSKTDSSQELQFPRGGDTEVPITIREAAYEIAYSILDGKDIEFELESVGEQSVSYGGARIRRNQEFTQEAYLHGIPSLNAWNMLLPYLRDGNVVKLERTD